MEFLELLEKDPEKLTELSIADYAKRGGIEGAEVVMWLIMRGALTPKVRKVHQSYCLPSMTATATVIYEDRTRATTRAKPEAYFAKSSARVRGRRRDRRLLSRSRSSAACKAYRLNKYLHGIIQPELRGRFLYDREGSYVSGGLTTKRRTW